MIPAQVGVWVRRMPVRSTTCFNGHVRRAGGCRKYDHVGRAPGRSNLWKIRRFDHFVGCISDTPEAPPDFGGT